MSDDLQIDLDVNLAPMRAALAEMKIAANAGAKVDLTPLVASVQRVDQQMKSTVNTLAAKDGIQALEGLQKGLNDVSAEASQVQFDVMGVSRAFGAVALAAKPLGLINANLGVLSATTGLAATGTGAVAGAFGMLSTVMTYFAIGLGMVVAPLRGLIIIPKLIAASFSLMFAVILAPFKILIATVSAAVRVVWALVKPVMKLAFAFFKLKVFIATLKIQFKLLGAFMGMLSPKLKVLFVGLVALGAAGRAGSVAMGILGKAVGLAGFAVLAVQQPLTAMGVALLQTGLMARRFVVRMYSATKAVLRFAAASAVSTVRSLGAAFASVAATVGGSVVGALASAAKMISLVVVAGAGWGMKLAADAEQAEIGFTTMLKSGTQAKALLAQLEQFAASTPFSLSSLRDGAKQLLNSGIAVQDLQGRLTQLGDIAAGTGKPIGDFVRIFAKVKSTGKVSLETLNQLAERGVPIYGALQSQMGVSRTEMLKLIGQGKVGFNELDGAIKSVSEGSGVFAGGMKAQSESISGLFSTIKDNVGFAMRSLGVEVMGAFDFKGLMKRGIVMFQSLKAGIESARPAFIATATVIKSAFAAVWEVVTVVFSSITSALFGTGGDFLKTFVEMATIASWAFSNWPTLAELAFVNLQLFLVQAAGAFMHFFSVQIPAYLAYFADNWQGLFSDAMVNALTFFENLGANIATAMTAIWDFIASGGTADFELAFKPLTDGFISTVREMPEIAEREIGALEASLTAQSEGLGAAVSGGLGEAIATAMTDLNDFRSAKVETPTLEDQAADPIGGGGDDTANAGKTRSNFVVDSLNRGSEEAFNAIFSAQGGEDKVQKDQLKVQKETAKATKKMANKPQIVLNVAGAVG